MARRRRTVTQQELERPGEPERLFGQSLEEDIQLLVEAARSGNLAPILFQMAQMPFEEQARLVGALRTRDLDLDPKTRQYLEQKIINPFQAAVGSVLVEQHLRPAETWATFQRISEQTEPGVPFWASGSGTPQMAESAPIAEEALSSPYPVSPIAAFREHLSTAGHRLKPEEVVRLKSTAVPAGRLWEIPGLVTRTTPEGKPVIVTSVKAEKFGARASLWMKAQEVSVPGQPTVESAWGEQIPVWKAAFIMDPAAAALLPEGGGLYDPNLRVYRYYSFYRKVTAPGGRQVRPEEVIRPGTTLTGEELKRVQISPGARPVTNLWRYGQAEVVSSGLFAKPGQEGEPPAQYSYAVFKVPVGAFEIKGAGAVKAGMAPDPLARRLGAEVVFSGAGNLQWVSIAEAWAAGNPEEAGRIIGRQIRFGESLNEEEVRKVLGYLSTPAHGYLKERAVRTRVSGRVLYGEFVPDDPAIYAALQEGRAKIIGSVRSLGGEGSAASATIAVRTPVLSIQLPIQAQETLQYRPSAMATRELVGQVLGFSQKAQERALQAGKVKSEAVMETFKVIAAQMGMLPQEEVETRQYGVQGEWGGASVRALGINFAAALHAQSWLLSHGYKLSEMSVSEKIAAAMKAFSAITEGMDINALAVTIPGGQRVLLPHPRYVSRLIGLPLDVDELKGEKAVSAGMYGSILLRALIGTDIFQGSVELPERVVRGYGEWASQIFRSGELLRTVGGGVVHRLGGIINPANYIPLNRVYIPQSRLGELIGRGKGVSDEEYERYLQEIAEGKRSAPVAVARIPALNETAVLRTISARELMELGVEEAQIRAMEESGAVYINPGIAYAKQGDLDRDVLMALKAAAIGTYRRVKEGAEEVVTRLRGAVPTSVHRLREMMLSSQEVKERVEKVRGAAPEREMLGQARQRMTALQELSVQDLIQVSIEQELNRQQAGPSYNAVERALAMAYGERGIPRGVREKLMLGGYQQNIDLKASPPEIQRLLATLGGAARPSGTPENEWSNPIWTETVAAVMGLGQGFTDKELAQLLVNPENQSNYQKVLGMVRAHQAGEKVYPTDWMLRFWESLGEKYLAEHPEAVEGKPEASRYIYQLLYGIRQAGGLPYASMLRMTGAMMDAYPAWDERKRQRFSGILSALMDVYPEAKELRGRLWLLRHGSAETIFEAQKRFAIAANAPELLQWMRSRWGPKIATSIVGKAWRALPKELQAPELFSSAAEQAPVAPPPPAEAAAPSPAEAAAPPPPPPPTEEAPAPSVPLTLLPGKFLPAKYYSAVTRIARARAQDVFRTLGSRYIQGKVAEAAPAPARTEEVPLPTVAEAPAAAVPPAGGEMIPPTAARGQRSPVGARAISPDEVESLSRRLRRTVQRVVGIPRDLNEGELPEDAGLVGGAALRNLAASGFRSVAGFVQALGRNLSRLRFRPARAAAAAPPASGEAIPLTAAFAQIDAGVDVEPVQAPPRRWSPADARGQRSPADASEQESPRDARAISPDEVESLSRQLHQTVQRVAGILRDLNEGELPEDVKLVGGAALRRLAAGEFHSIAGFVQALGGNLPRSRFRSLTRVAAAYFAGRPLSAEAITTVREFLGDEEARAIAYELERPSILAQETRKQRARLSAMMGGLTDDAVAYEGFRQLLPQIGEFTKKLREATDGVKDFGEFLEKIGGEEEYKRLVGISNLARGAARYAAKLSESPGEREQIVVAASQLSQAIMPARAMERLAALNPPPPPPKWRRADWQGGAWDEEGFNLGRAFSNLTGGWALWWLRRWWGITGGQAWSAAREAATLEQTYQQMVWSSTGGQPQLPPMTADMMRFYSSLAATRLEMGRAAYSAYWANFQIPQGLGSIGGLALPALGVGGTLAGVAALSGLLSWGTAISMVGAPAALITLTAGLASYGARLSEDRPRYVLASQGYGSALDRFLTGGGGARLADALRYALGYSLMGTGGIPLAPSYEEELQRARQQEADANRREAQRLLYGNWEQLNPAERQAVLRGVVQRLTQKGQPFQYWTEETLQGAVGAIAPYVGINPRDLMMGQGQRLLQYMLAANLSGQDVVRLARMLNVRPLEVPQALGQFGGLYSITRASDIIDRYYGGFLNYGVEFQDLARSVLSGRLPDVLSAQQQYFLGRLLAQNPRAWAQMAVAMGIPTLAYQDLMGLPLGMATPLPIGMSGAAFSRMMRASRQQIMERLLSTGGLSFIGGWGEDTLWGLQDEMTMANLAYQRQHAALQRRQMALHRQFVTGVQWPYQDVMRQMEYAQQMGGTTPGGLQMTGAFNWQIISANLSLRQFLENWGLSRRQYELSRAGQERDWTYQMWARGFQRETALLQRGWTREDWAISAARAGIEFGWSLEDINEAIRHSTGLQRRRLLRERDRLVARFGWSQEDRERAERRQEELWKRQDEMWRRETAHLEDVTRRQRAIQDLELERLELAKRHYLEDHELRMRQIEEAKAFWQEQWERQSAYIQRQREYELAQMDLQRQQLELSVKHAEVVAGLQLSMTDLTRKMQVWQNLVEVEVPKALQKSFEEIVRKLAEVVAGTQFGSLPAPTGTHPPVRK